MRVLQYGYLGFPKLPRISQKSEGNRLAAVAAAVGHRGFEPERFWDGQAGCARHTRPSRFPKSRAQCTGNCGSQRGKCRIPSALCEGSHCVCACVDVVCREPHPFCVGNFFLRAESLAAPASYHDETGHGSAASCERQGSCCLGSCFLAHPPPARQCWLAGEVPASRPAPRRSSTGPRSMYACRSLGVGKQRDAAACGIERASV